MKWCISFICVLLVLLTKGINGMGTSDVTETPGTLRIQNDRSLILRSPLIKACLLGGSTSK